MSNLDSIPLPKDPRFKDLTGHVFGRLTVVGYAGRNSQRKSRWNCLCDCGVTTCVVLHDLSSGNTKSCGCLRKDACATRRHKHGMSDQPEFWVWADMWKRCTNQKHKFYHLYKDRTPPPEWRSFAVFYAELGPRPSPNHSLDRIDNDKPYGPGNCRWVTQHTQTRNTSRNVWVTVDGRKEVLADACMAIGLSYQTLKSRRSKGQTLEEASNGRLKLAA